ncbi:DNA methyltransferase [Microbacterium sp. SSW1-59]|uniref:Eco57I restriction-modification methylase domain-containing protein n=1 Tax=Microbacterium xanthum TaxID=3079794 RepID=UPI002AD28A78|nr:DNA methyltransferase [Microbacterium sp. SSW1-59]MDZ8202082.1 DNA methyltransferase [Microbacterium sp. SSW1-59]
MASLFGEFQLRELAADLQIPDLAVKIETLRAWQNDYHNGTLKADNETSREQAYNRDMFGVVLGYVDKPASPFTFEAKSSTDTGQIPDARIGWFDSAAQMQRTVAVVELKGASISLDRPQKNHGNLSPVQQGFKYRPQYRGCEFVIVSNFYEFRLYNDNQLDYEAWTLDDLVDPADDYLTFRVFYLLLASSRFVAPVGKTPTQEMLLDIRGKQEEIGRQFYADYRDARARLISSIWLLNGDRGFDSAVVIDKAQKVVDRIVFACFAEDRGLLPEKTVARVLRDGDASSFGSLWSTFRSFFEAVDQGSAKLGIARGFNGGLYAKDDVLDSMNIGDAALRDLANLSQYNFVEDLSVSILGHIFEQSINDLELIQSAAASTGSLAESNLSQRKMGGIYYTPEAAVRSIIDESLGRYLRTAEERFIRDNNLRERIGDKKYAELERVAYMQYRTFLHNIRVLDPACGSGAFLVGALDYLAAEHRRIAQIIGDDLLAGEDFIKEILQQNLFGVDVNAGSVEITKLSLWLKSARKGQQLTTLDANIRCGNSLISDHAVAGARALVWEAEFADVFGDGGFDVVIGNPPYVDSETMVRTSPLERTFITGAFTSASGNWDLFVPFFQRAFDLTRSGGVCTMIVPNKIVSAPYAQALREYIEDHGSLVSITDVSRDGIFDVDVYPVIVTTRKAPSTGTVEVASGLGPHNEVVLVELPGTGTWDGLFHEAPPAGTRPLSAIAAVHSAAAVAEAYALKEVLDDDASAMTKLKVINTGTIDPYSVDWALWPMRYIKQVYTAPVVAEADLPKPKAWLGQSMIAVAGMAQRVEAVVSTPHTYLPAKSTVVVVPLSELDAYGLVALLNSTPFSERFIAANQFAAMAGGYVTITKTNLGVAPIPADLSSVAANLNRLGRLATDQRNELYKMTTTLRSVLVSEFGHIAWSKRLLRWWELDFQDYASSIGVSMTMKRKADLVKFHSEMRANALVHAEAFNQAIVDIDDVVSRAYLAVAEKSED